MDHQTIEQQNVVEFYVTGKLEPEEAARFEAHYLDCATCVDAVEDAERLLRGLGHIAAEETAQALTTQRLAFFAWNRWRTMPRTMPLLAAALVALALLPAGWQYQQANRLRQQLEEQRRPQVNTSIIPLAPFRDSPLGERSVHQISLAAQPEWIVLSLDLGATDHPLYRATLFGAEENIVWRAEGLEPNYLGALTVSVHSSWLAPGEYNLALAGLPGGPEPPVQVARFSLRVIEFAD